jgi:hypothetical protein
MIPSPSRGKLASADIVLPRDTQLLGVRYNEFTCPNGSGGEKNSKFLARAPLLRGTVHWAGLRGPQEGGRGAGKGEALVGVSLDPGP